MNCNCDMSIWLSVDPMSDARPSLSPYNYCSLNPVGRIDPDGALDEDDGYLIDDKGNISSKPINNEGGNQYDVLYAKNKYSEKTRKDYDETGNKTGIKVSKGFLRSNIETLDYYYDSGGDIIGDFKSNRYKLTSDIESQNLMLFFDNNTNVEFSNTLYKNAYGKLFNIIYTEHDDGHLIRAKYIKEPFKNAGCSVVRDDHIHPSGGHDPSGVHTSEGYTGDKGHKRWVLTWSPNAKFRIIANGTTKEY